MAKIEDHKYSIQEAFLECFYIIPDYQREYVWTEKEVNQLLGDIDEQLESSSQREYFIGTILVSPVTLKNTFEVIDGQQRLTTFFLILCALRQRFKGEPLHKLLTGFLSTSYADLKGNVRTSLRLEPRYEQAGELLSRLVEMDADPETTKAKIHASDLPSFGSLERLLNAYQTIYRYLDVNYSEKERCQEFWAYLANNVVFIQISTDVSTALKIFETINERGVGLNPMDLLKNILFTQVNPKDFTRLKGEWQKVVEPLQQAKEKPLRFLRYFIMSRYKVKSSWRDGILREDEIYNWLVDKENASLCGYKDDPFGFVRSIIRSVDLFVGFTQARGNDQKPSAAMDSMQRLCGAAFSLHYILLMAACGLPVRVFDHFVRQLESFLFYYIFTKTPTKELERNFSSWADDLRLISAMEDQDAQKKTLDSFVAKKFQANMSAKQQELKDALKRYSLNSMQHYRTRYLLAKLTQHVELSFKGMSVAGPLSDFTSLEIEHILPNTPNADLKATFSTLDPGKRYDDLKVRLGNLTLLEKPINIVAGNGFFSEKRAHYGKSGNYLTRSMVSLSSVGVNSSVTRINKKLLAFESWSSDAIERRQEMLIDLALEVWKTAPL